MDRSDSERLAVIEAILKSINLRLFGRDGDGGVIEHLDKRVAKLENWRWWVIGIAIGAGAATGGLASHVIEAIIK